VGPYGTGYLLIDLGEIHGKDRWKVASDLLEQAVRFWRDFFHRYAPVTASKFHEQARSDLPARCPGTHCCRGDRAAMRFLEFFAANIRNPHTRRAYARAADEFLAWCASVGLSLIAVVDPVHLAAWIEPGTRELSAPSVKQRLAALRHLFDRLVNGHVRLYWRGARHVGRGCLHAEPSALGAAARKGRQAACNATTTSTNT
jgi:hypothetical protein